MIGRAYVRERNRMDPRNRGDKMQPPEGYDSVYIAEKDDSQQS